MAGASLTVYDLLAGDLKLIFYTVTLDSSADADFSEYSTIHLVLGWDATNPGATTEAVTSVTDAGDVRYTNANNEIVGFAIVQD